jgi:hypothetical protein
VSSTDGEHPEGTLAAAMAHLPRLRDLGAIGELNRKGTLGSPTSTTRSRGWRYMTEAMTYWVREAGVDGLRSHDKSAWEGTGPEQLGDQGAPTAPRRRS